MGVFFILKRDLLSHWIISRNNREGLRIKSWRLFWCCIYLAKAFFIGINAIRSEKLGSKVRYKGHLLRISNWAGSDYPTLAGDGFYQQYVPRSEIENVINVGELWHRFVFGFGFYMGNWHKIDVQRRLYPEHWANHHE